VTKDNSLVVKDIVAMGTVPAGGKASTGLELRNCHTPLLAQFMYHSQVIHI
jgi:hypothetical protein